MKISLIRFPLLVAVFLLAFPALAQSPAEPSSATAVEVENLLETLKDDAKREAFVADLEAMVAANRQLQAETEKSVGVLVLEKVSEKMDTIGIELAGLAKEIGNIPKILTSVQSFFIDSENRGDWLLLLGQLVLILAVGDFCRADNKTFVAPVSCFD